MAKVFFSVGMSLDSFIAPEGMDLYTSSIRDDDAAVALIRRAINTGLR